MAFIQNLQKKSDKEKRLIIFIVVIVFMVGIFFIWVPQFKSFLRMKNEAQKENNSILKIPENIKEVYKSSSETVGNIKEALEEIK